MNMRISIFSLLVFAAACASDPDDRTLTRPDASMSDVGEPDAGPVEDDMDSADAAVSLDVAMPGDMGSSNLCQPNRDGTIERHEVTLEAGLAATFRVASEASWSTVGESDASGQRWDMTGDLANDQDVLITLEELSGKWFETTFAGADYVTPLSNGSDLLGAFEVTDDAVLLLGVASPDDGVFRTELTYDPPIPVLQFPLAEGNTWSVESTVSGTYEGVISVYTETYAFEVDASGTLNTPYAEFPVLRVRSVLDRQVGILTTVIRSFAFVSECFGTVATVASREDEDQVDFEEVSELRRLAP